MGDAIVLKSNDFDDSDITVGIDIGCNDFLINYIVMMTAVLINDGCVMMVAVVIL